VTAVSDAAAQAAIGAAARELKLPTVRDQAAGLAEIAAREQSTYLAYLAEVLAAELDDRSARRRARRIAEARFPRVKRLADFNADAVPSLAPASSPAWHPAPTWTKASRSCCSATAAPARPPAAPGNPAKPRYGPPGAEIHAADSSHRRNTGH
jgi:hypothetical protein